MKAENNDRVLCWLVMSLETMGETPHRKLVLQKNFLPSNAQRSCFHTTVPMHQQNIGFPKENPVCTFQSFSVSKTCQKDCKLNRSTEKERKFPRQINFACSFLSFWMLFTQLPWERIGLRYHLWAMVKDIQTTTWSCFSAGHSATDSPSTHLLSLTDSSENLSWENSTFDWTSQNDFCQIVVSALHSSSKAKQNLGLWIPVDPWTCVYQIPQPESREGTHLQLIPLIKTFNTSPGINLPVLPGSHVLWSASQIFCSSTCWTDYSSQNTHEGWVKNRSPFQGMPNLMLKHLLLASASLIRYVMSETTRSTAKSSLLWDSIGCSTTQVLVRWFLLRSRVVLCTGKSLSSNIESPTKWRLKPLKTPPQARKSSHPSGARVDCFLANRGTLQTMSTWASVLVVLFVTKRECRTKGVDVLHAGSPSKSADTVICGMWVGWTFSFFSSKARNTKWVRKCQTCKEKSGKYQRSCQKMMHPLKLPAVTCLPANRVHRAKQAWRRIFCSKWIRLLTPNISQKRKSVEWCVLNPGVPWLPSLEL